MQKQFSLFFQHIPTLTAIVLSLLFFSLARNCYLADSEIWLLTLSQKVFHPGDLKSIYYKWIFHFVTAIFSWGAPDEWSISTWARSGWAALALLTALINSYFFSRLYQNQKLFFPLFIFTLTSSLFFNQGFRIRGDILATFWHLLFLCSVFYWPPKFSKSTQFFTLFALNLLLFLTTPKALIYIFLQFFIGYFSATRSHQKEDLHLARRIWLSLLLPFLLGTFLLSTSSWLFPNNSLLVAFTSALDFYLKSFDPLTGGAEFLKKSDYFYLWRFFNTSLAHTFIFVIWFVFFLRNLFNPLQDRRQPVVFFQTYTALLCVFIFLYNQKLPFFLAAFLIPALSQQFCFIYTKWQRKPLQSWLIPLCLSGACLLTVRQYVLNLQFNNNIQQKEFIQALDQYKTAHPQTQIYDVIGLLPRKNDIFIFVGPGEASRKQELIENIKTAAPDLVIYTFKNTFLEPEILQFLQKNYVSSSSGIWLKATHFSYEKDPQFFLQVQMIDHVPYWLTPWTKPSFVFNTLSGQDLTSQVIFLDESRVPNRANPKYLAIPANHLHVSFADTPPFLPPGLAFDLFRFDTSF